MLSFKEFLVEAKKESASQAAERIQISALRAQHAILKKNHPSGVPVDIGNGEIHHVTSIQKVPGNPKSDVRFHTSNPKRKLEISLKNKADQTEYRQLGGVSRAKSMKESPLIKKFAKHLSKETYDETSPRHGYSLDRSNPEHNRLFHQAMFGHDYGTSGRGIHNVDAIHMGNVRFEKHPKIKGAYQLTSDKSFINGDLPNTVHGELVRENSKKQNDLGISNSRVYISIKGHNKTEDITNKVNAIK